MEIDNNVETPIENEGQLEENTDANLGNEENPQENPQDNEPQNLDPESNPAEPQEPENNYYSPEEMRTLQVDGIDTSRIPPEMQALYQAMQKPITKKSMELSDKLKNLGQGQQQPPQDNQPQQVAQPSLDEVAEHVTLQKLGLTEKPEPWDAGFERYVLELSDTRRDVRESSNRQSNALKEINDFRAGFTPEQFKSIDDEAETKMYQMLADPATKAEGQRIQQAVKMGDTQTVLAFTREVAKEVLSRAPQKANTRTTPPVADTPSGGQMSTGQKDPTKMSNDEYRAWRNSQ